MKKGDIVIFTGKSETYYPYEDPTNLVKYKTYEVESVIVYDWRTDVKLKGAPGTFSSTWFLPAPARKKFGYEIQSYGKAKFIYSSGGEFVYDAKGNKLGTLKDLANFAYNNEYIIDFSNMVVKKA